MLSTRTPVKFTARQLQVVRLIAEGYSNDEMATVLGVRPRTVKAHCDSLRMKLGVSRKRHIPFAYRELTGADPRALPILRPDNGARDESRTPN